MTVFLSINCFVFSQLPCPLQSGEIIPPILRCWGGRDESMNLIKSDNNQVISLEGGNVSSILTHSDNTKTLIIRNNDDFYTYSNLDKILVNLKDQIQKDQIIALASWQEDEENYQLIFQSWKRTQLLKVTLACTKPH